MMWEMGYERGTMPVHTLPTELLNPVKASGDSCAFGSCYQS